MEGHAYGALSLNGTTGLGNDPLKSVWDDFNSLGNSAGTDSILSAIQSVIGKGTFQPQPDPLSTSFQLNQAAEQPDVSRGASAGVLESSLSSQPIGPSSKVEADTDSLTGMVDSEPLVSAQAINTKINFQPDSAPVPTGYTKDIGQAYSNTRGYGWVRQDSLSKPTHTPIDITPNARDRNRAGIDQRLDTLLHMQYVGPSTTAVKTPAAWEYALPDGTYSVTVSVGDQPGQGGAYDSQHTINVEGIKAINRFQSSSTSEYKQATVQVAVTDGRLTIDAIGGNNTKINYLNINSAPPAFTQINWSNAAASPIGRTEAQGGVVDGKLYVFGGFISNPSFGPTNRSDVYDPDTNKWTQIPSMPKRLTHVGTAVDGKNIYFAGGYVGSSSTNFGAQTFATKDVWKYNVDTKTWSAMPPLPAARGSGELSVLGRNLHFFSGADINRVDQGDHWALNLDNPTSWVPKASLPNPRSHMGDAVIVGKIYAIGGQHSYDEKSVTQTSVHAYNPSTNTWTAVAPLPKARSHISGATFVMNGRIIVAGGEPTHLQPVSDVTAYNPVTNTWTALTPLPVPRYSGIAGRIDNQIFYTTGSGRSSTTYKGAPVK